MLSKQQPLKPKLLTCAGFALGDSPGQINAGRPPIHRIVKIDAARTARMANFGIFLQWPCGHRTGMNWLRQP
jgi:hypothetical protein